MGVLEILLFGLNAVFLAALVVPFKRRDRLLYFLPAGFVFALLGHLGLEKFRWTLIPLYFLSILALFYLARLIFRRMPATRAFLAGHRKWLRVVGGFLGFFPLTLSLFLSLMFPVFRFLPPAGPFSVGVRYTSFVSADRPEPFIPGGKEKRSVSMMIFYPTDSGGRGPIKPYWEDAPAINRAFSRFNGIPAFLVGHLGLVKTHSRLNAAVNPVTERFPVVLFSGAAYSPMSQNTALMEDLASRGYVAISVGHPYESLYVVDENGRAVTYDPQNEGIQLRVREMPELSEEAMKAVTGEPDLRIREEKVRALFLKIPNVLESVKIRAADIGQVLDALEKGVGGVAFLSGRIDTKRVGVIGHSLGGTAAAQACLDDSRVAAGINLDGLMPLDALDRPIPTPFAVFLSEQNMEREGNERVNRLMDLFVDRMSGVMTVLVIRGTNHFNYSDYSLLGPGFRKTGLLGPIEGSRCLAVQNEYIAAFFDRILKGRPSPLLDGPSSLFPEVEILSPGR